MWVTLQGAPLRAVPLAAYTSGLALGNQAAPGVSFCLDFTVISAISVTALGAFDDLGPDLDATQSNGFIGQISVAIFSQALQEAVTPVLTFQGNGDTQDGAFRFKNLNTPVTLLPGDYSVVAEGFSSNDLLGNMQCLNNTSSNLTCLTDPYGFAPPNMQTNGFLIQFTGSGRYSTAGIGIQYPTLIQGQESPHATLPNEYLAGNFVFAAESSVPEPSVFWLAGGGFTVMLIRRRRLRRHGAE